jgi:hypothetical protein
MRVGSSVLLEKLFNSIPVVLNVVRDPLARNMLELIIDDKYPLYSLKDLVAYAYINKVLNLLVIHGPSRFKEIELAKKLIDQRMKFLKHLYTLVNVLEGINIEYVIFKTYKPVPETPVDIDICVYDLEDALQIVKALKIRFKVEICNVDRFSIGIKISDLSEYVDIYVDPHASNFIYLSNDTLLNNRQYIDINEFDLEFQIPIPSFAAEALTVISHAIIKEGIMTLNDILTTTTYMQTNLESIFALAKRESLDLAIKLFLKKLESDRFPTRFKVLERFPAIAQRSIKRESFASIPYFLESIIKKRRMLLEALQKITYVRGLSR